MQTKQDTTAISRSKLSLTEVASGAHGYVNITQMFAELYTSKRLSLSTIAGLLRVSKSSLYRAAKKAGVRMRPEGGANYRGRATQA